MTNWQREELRKLLKECSEFVFGDCIGSDIEAADIALNEDVKIFTVYPQNKDSRKRAWFYNPDKDIKRENGQWNLYPSGIRIRWMPAKPPLERNKLIVDNCEYMIATPKEFEHTIRSGTWATIRYAWKTKKNHITIIPPKED
jgi:hypothetical protein